MGHHLACGLAVAALFAGPDRPANKADAGAIQGVWKITSSEEQGEVDPPEKFKAMAYVFKGGKVAIELDGKAVVEGKYELDPSKEPKHIDLKLGDENSPGIYKLNGDGLTVCAPAFASNKTRPTEFKAPKGSRLMLMKLERVKK